LEQIAEDLQLTRTKAPAPPMTTANFSEKTLLDVLVLINEFNPEPIYATMDTSLLHLCRAMALRWFWLHIESRPGVRHWLPVVQSPLRLHKKALPIHRPRRRGDCGPSVLGAGGVDEDSIGLRRRFAGEVC
jgi:hypothetical protein